MDGGNGNNSVEQMLELLDGDRSLFRDKTFILYGEQCDIVERDIARAAKPRDPNNPNRSPEAMRSPRSPRISILSGAPLIHRV